MRFQLFWCIRGLRGKHFGVRNMILYCFYKLLRTSQKSSLEHHLACLKTTTICDFQKLRKRYKTCVKSKILAPRRPSGGRFYWFCICFISKTKKLKIANWKLGRGLGPEHVCGVFMGLHFCRWSPAKCNMLVYSTPPMEAFWSQKYNFILFL